MAVFGVTALAAATVTWLFLTRASRGLRHLEAKLDDRGHAVRGRLVAAAGDLASLRTHGERALWALERADVRLDAMARELAARRRGSDTLRAQLLGSEARLHRIREGARLLLRAIELRRDLLG